MFSITTFLLHEATDVTVTLWLQCIEYGDPSEYLFSARLENASGPMVGEDVTLTTTVGYFVESGTSTLRTDCGSGGTASGHIRTTTFGAVTVCCSQDHPPYTARCIDSSFTSYPPDPIAAPYDTLAITPYGNDEWDESGGFEWSPNGLYLAAAGNRTLTVVSYPEKQVAFQNGLTGSNDATDLAYDDAGGMIAVSDRSHNLYKFNATTGASLGICQNGSDDPNYSLDWSSASSLWVGRMAGTTCQLQRVDRTSCAQQQCVSGFPPCTGDVTRIRRREQSGRLAVTSSDCWSSPNQGGALGIYESNGAAVRLFSNQVPNEGPFYDCDWLPGGAGVVAGGEQFAAIYPVGAGAPVPLAATDMVYSVAGMASDRVAIGDYATVRIFNALGGVVGIWTLPSQICDMAWNEVRDVLAVATASRTVLFNFSNDHAPPILYAPTRYDVVYGTTSVMVSGTVSDQTSNYLTLYSRIGAEAWANVPILPGGTFQLQVPIQSDQTTVSFKAVDLYRQASTTQTTIYRPPASSACCNPSDGTCTLSPQAGCTAPNIWHPEWTACSPMNPCPPNSSTGTCCNPFDGTCAVTVQAACAAPNVWHPEWTACTPNNPCSQPSANGSISAWGLDASGQCTVPPPNTGFVALSAGRAHSLGLKSDGTVVAWGDNSYDQRSVAVPNVDFVAVSAGAYHSLGLKSDGTVVAWGDDRFGQTNLPTPNTGFTAVAAGGQHSLALRSDGTVIAWGSPQYGQIAVPAPNGDFVAIAAGYYHSLALKSDGTIVTWGWNEQGQRNVPAPNADFVAIAAGGYHSLGLKSDGTIVAWGWDSAGQIDVPSPNVGFAAIAGGFTHSLGLKSGGTIVAWGANADGQTNVPIPNAGFAAIAGGYSHSLALRPATSPPGVCCNPSDGSCMLTLEADCAAPSTWNGSGTTCSPNSCPQPGPCCDASNGACTLVLETGCTGPLTWNGAPSCTPNPCPQLGACCVPLTGACTLAIEAQCAAPNVWHEEWTACSPNPCPRSHLLHVPTAGYPTIQSALSAAVSGDTVLVDAGDFNESVAWPALNGVVLRGAGAFTTTVHGTGGTGLTMSYSGIDTATVVQDIAWIGPGTGIALNGASPKLLRCRIANNVNSGLIITGASPVIDDCDVLDNSAYNGGGVYLNGGSPVFRCTRIVRNTARYGGAMRCWPTNAVFRSCVLAENSAKEGGAVYCNAGNLSFTATTLSRNVGGVPSWDNCPAGAVAVWDGAAVSFSRCAIAENVSPGVGATVCGGGTAQHCNFVTNGTAWRQSQPSQGSAIQNWWGHESGPLHPTLNPAGLGDAVYIADVAPWLVAADVDAPPFAPMGVLVNAPTGQGGKPGLAWNPVPLTDLAGYRVYYNAGTPGYPYSNVVDVGNALSCVLQGLQNGVTYYLAVTSYDLQGHESWYSRETSLVPPISGIGDLAVGRSSSIVPVPNPFRTGTTIHYYVGTPEQHTLEILDVAGRLVLAMPGVTGPAGLRALRWDGRDAGGKLVPGGPYFLRIAGAGGGSRSTKVLLIR